MPAAASSPSSSSRRPQTATTGTPAAPAAVGDPDRGLAAQALRVERSLAGDHEVGTGDAVVEAEQVEHQLDARAQLGAQRGHEGEADAARGPRTGLVAAVRAGRARDHVGPVPERGVERDHLVGVAPFCGP